MIVPLTKITLCGLLREKARILSDLQGMGCLHLIPLRELPEELRESGPSSQSREALKFLQDSPQKLRPFKEAAAFDPFDLETRILELRDRIQELEEERDSLLVLLGNLQPWGDFTFPPVEDLGGYRLWFYAVPLQLLRQLPADLIYVVANRDNRFAYLTVIAPQEPDDMPVARVRVGRRAPRELQQRLEAVEMELEDLQLERTNLTRWRLLLARSLDRLEDEAALNQAAMSSLSDGPVFALQAWAPVEQTEALLTYARHRGLVCAVTPPEAAELPPTLLRNPPRLASGQDLVRFYKTPSYWAWDPSAVVLLSFALFFAMIVADAGYSLLLSLGLAGFWRRLGASEAGGRFRTFAAILCGFSVTYGVLVNSYFGIPFPPGTWPARLGVVDLHDFNTMMGLSVGIGICHLMLANAFDAWSKRWSWAMVAPCGWILIFAGASGYFLASLGYEPLPGLATGGIGLMTVGGLGVLIFTSVQGSWGQRLLSGVQGLSRAIGAFGDTLSYLRLFALGLASASLAVNFNLLAQNAKAAYPALGLLLASLIAISGHAINLLLAIASGFIHGLRLNFIEFFNWSLSDEGIPFQAFRRKEKS